MIKKSIISLLLLFNTFIFGQGLQPGMNLGNGIFSGTLAGNIPGGQIIPNSITNLNVFTNNSLYPFIYNGFGNGLWINSTNSVISVFTPSNNTNIVSLWDCPWIVTNGTASFVLSNVISGMYRYTNNTSTKVIFDTLANQFDSPGWYVVSSDESTIYATTVYPNNINNSLPQYPNFTWGDAISGTVFPLMGGYGSLYNISILTNGPARLPIFNLIRTNFISGFWYTNTSQLPIEIKVNVQLTTAASVNGSADMQLWIPGVVNIGATNEVRLGEPSVSSLLLTNIVSLGGFIPA